MAKKRKTSRRRTTRRRRGVGATNPGNILMQLGGVVAGVAAAGYLNKLALSSQSENVQAAVPIAVGIALPMFMKNEFAKNLGAGMVAYGGGKFLQKAGLGEADDSMDEAITISGDDLSVIAGDDDFAMAGDDLSVIAGDDDFAMAGDEISVLAGIES